MKYPPVAFVCALLLSAFSSDAGAMQGQWHTWWKAGFSTPVAFSAPQKAGMDAVTLVQPVGASPGKARMEITLVAVPAAMREEMGFKGDAELADYVKGTFLGTTKPADRTVERTFGGKTLSGGVQNVAIPKKGELTLFLIPLSGGDTLALGFVSGASVPPGEAKGVLETISRTFREVPE